MLFSTSKTLYLNKKDNWVIKLNYNYNYCHLAHWLNISYRKKDILHGICLKVFFLFLYWFYIEFKTYFVKIKKYSLVKLRVNSNN